MYFDETAIVESLMDKTEWFENSRMLTRFSFGCYFDLVRCCDPKAGCIFCSCFKENVK